MATTQSPPATAGADLLQSIRQAEGQAAGRLKLFFGYAAGVGKTYAMLQAAHQARAEGVDVVVGVVAPHTPLATTALLAGLEQLPPGLAAGELALDAALARHPALLLLDDLAHTNAPGSRHLKRYQDVQELLRAGIDVYTTVDVQALESLADQVQAVTGAAVENRIPDPVFDAADELRVVDIEPDALQKRQGAVGQSSAANPEAKLNANLNTNPSANPAQSSTQRLTELRKLMFRRAADHLDHAHAPAGGVAGKTGEHILVCLSGAPTNAKVIRTAARLAEAFHCGFTALYVESPDFSRIDEEERHRLQVNLRLAEQLGARIATMYGDDPAIQIAEYARLGGITKIVLGRSLRRPAPLTRPGLMDQLAALAPGIDIYIIPDQATSPPAREWALPLLRPFSLRDGGLVVGILALCTLVGYLFVLGGLTSADIIMVYILGVLCTAMVTEGRTYSLVASALSVLVFNFCFTQPYFSLRSAPGYLATFGVMFLVALLGSTLTVRIKQQATQSAQKAYRTEVLLETSRKLQKAVDAPAIYTAAAAQLGKLLECPVLFYPAGDAGGLQPPLLYPRQNDAPGDPQRLAACLAEPEQAVARWVLKNNKHAGATTRTLPDAAGLYMAVR
ncbi:MAG: DUF4118 domain-containing protein, partial [Gemmiger sp.]|nr:DUF4118 domain-containing protein [Gemmiger sp.]